MANKTTTPSLQDILRKRQQSDFVGRAQQVADFRANLRFDVTDERRKFIFSVSGQGGVGKTWLARRLRKIAEEFGAATALTDEAETDVPSAMGRIADQLEEQGHPLKAFSERYKVYRQRKQELEADPDAPQGLTAFVTRTVVDVGFDLLEHTPAGVITKRLPREMLATQASEWAEFVRRKLANKDETRLVLEPIPVLTPLWLAGLAEIAQEHPLALFLDTYERTCPFLDPWLREVLEGRHGIVPANIVWAISGRDALDDNDWAPYRGLMAAAALEPFTEEEAREYLGSKGITDPKIVEVILRLSGRLPLLVATLATQSPSDAEHIEDPADTAVERFLKWVDDPAQRRAALHAALPRRLNQDILACLVDPAQVEVLFAWLQTMPFVQKRGDYWEYHEVVRSAMLRYFRTQSPKTWADLHRRMAEHYETMREGLGLDAEAGRRDSAWQEFALEALYHRLCQAPKANLSAAVNGFLLASKGQRTFRRRWAETMCHAGEDTSAAECTAWGARLAEGLAAYETDRYEAAIAMFTAFLELPALEPALRPVALGWRGRLCRLADRHDQAIADLSEAISLAPEVAEYWGDRGAANFSRGELTAALADLDQAVALDADLAWAIALRGETYRIAAQHEAALTDLDRAIALNPEDAAFLTSRSLVNAALKRYSNALADIQQAISIAPQDLSLLSWKMSLQIQMGEWGQAAEAADEVASRTSDWVRQQQAALQSMLPEVVQQRMQSFLASLGLDAQTAQAQASHWLEILTGKPEALAEAVEVSTNLVQGLGHVEAGEIAAALANFDHAIALDPGNLWILEQRGALYYQMGRYEAALVDFDRSVALRPDNATFVLRRSLANAALKRYVDALADIQRATSITPQDPTLLSWKMLLQVQMGEWEQAAETASSIASQASGWIREQQVVLQSLPTEVAQQRTRSFLTSLGLDAQTAQARASHWLGMLTGEVGALAQAVEADTALVQGLGHIKAGQTAAAVTNFDRAIALNPDNTAPYVLRGETFRKVGKYEEALSDYGRAIELEPNNASILASRAEIYRLMGEDAKALPDFDRAIELEPDNAWAVARRGETYRRMGEFAKALPDFDRAIELNSDYIWAIVGRAKTLRLLRRYEEALADFERAFKLGYDRDKVLVTYGLTLSYLGRYAEAIAVYEERLRGNPANYVDLYNIAVAAVRWKGLDLSEPAIREASEVLERANNGEDGAALYGLGGLAALKGNPARALDYLRQAITLEPSATEWVQHDIAWLDLRSDPDFQALLTKENSD